jgi:hypothetical protein
VVPVLRREFAALRKPGVPEAPVHPRVAATRMAPADAPAAAGEPAMTGPAAAA